MKIPPKFDLCPPNVVLRSYADAAVYEIRSNR
jgi:hypothetical protein